MCFKRCVHAVICNPFLGRGHKHPEEGGIALRTLLQRKTARLGKRKGWLFKKNSCWILKREIRAATSCSLCSAPSKQQIWRRQISAARCPWKTEILRVCLGIPMDKLLRGNCFSKSTAKLHWAEIAQGWNHTICPMLVLALQVTTTCLLDCIFLAGPTRNAKDTFLRAKMWSRSKGSNFKLLLLNSVLPCTMGHMTDHVHHINL